MLSVAVLFQLIGLVLLFSYGRFGILGILAGLLCLVYGGVLYRQALKRRRAEKEDKNGAGRAA